MGVGISGSDSQSQTNQTSTENPWAPQTPYITQQFSDASNLYNQLAPNAAYNGSLYAQINPQQEAAAQQASNSSGSIYNLGNAGANSLSNLYGNAGAYSGVASNLAANGVQGANQGMMSTLENYGSGAQQANLVNNGLSGALNSAGTQGASTISGLLGGFQNVANQATQDPTKQLSADASSYMNSAPVQSAINSTNAQIGQTLNEQTLPGLNQQAAMGGSLNSSRAGAANAMAQEGAAIAEGNADSSILNNAYNTGLSTASSNYQNGMNTALNAASSGVNAGLNTGLGTANLQNNEGQYNTATQLGAANSALGNQSTFEGLNANTQLNANQQLGQGIFDAALGTNNVANADTSAYGLGSTYGNLLQGNQQGIDTGNYNQYLNNQQVPWADLSNYANIIDAIKLPSQSSSQSTSGSSMGGSVQVNA